MRWRRQAYTGSLRSPAIRFLATLTTTLLLTAAIGLGGYSLLLQWRRAPSHDPLPPVAMPSVQHLPIPTPLPSTPLALPTMAPVMTAATVPAVELHLRLHGAPTTLPDAGVAVFQADRGSDHHWTPVTSGQPTGDGDLLFRLPAFARGDVLVTFAPQRLAARHGYLARTRVAIPKAGPTAEVVLDASCVLVTFHLPPGVDRVGPVRLSRPEDPQWLPMAQDSTDFTLTDSEPLRVLLGAGAYEVSSPLQPAHRQAFAVPATRELILLCAPASPPAGRQ